MSKPFEIRGADAVLARLSALEKAGKQNAICRRGLRAGAEVLRSAVAANAPQGETDELRKGPKIRAGKRSRRGPRLTVAYRKRKAGPAFHAHAVEFGTNRDGSGQGPQHFGEEAFEARKGRAAAVAQAAILADLEALA